MAVLPCSYVPCWLHCLTQYRCFEEKLRRQYRTHISAPHKYITLDYENVPWIEKLGSLRIHLFLRTSEIYIRLWKCIVNWRVNTFIVHRHITQNWKCTVNWRQARQTENTFVSQSFTNTPKTMKVLPWIQCATVLL